jgi:hypothetical protein
MGKMTKPSAVFCLIVLFNFLIYSFVIISGVDREYFNVDGAYFTSMPFDFDYSYETGVVVVFLSLMMCGFGAYLMSGTSAVEHKNSNVNFNFNVKHILNEKSSRYDTQATLILLTLILFSLVHFLMIEKSVLWYNLDYQIIKTPEDIGNSGIFFRMYHFLFRIVGIFAAVTMVYYFSTGKFLNFAASFVLFSYSFFLLYVGESRWINIYIFVLFFSRYIFFRRKPSFLEIIFWLVIFVFLFVKVIVGRNFGVYGVAVQGEIISEVASLNWIAVLFGMMINFGDGFLNLANTSVHDFLYSLEYKVGSFSPFPSVIDGFSEIQEEEHRISLFVPFNALSEAYSFGAPYFLLLLFIIFLFLYSSDRVYNLVGLYGRLILVVILFWNVFLMFGYPIRNVMRVFEYVTLINFIIIIRKS